MKALEVVKMWNEKKGTKLSIESDSSSVKRVQGLMNKYGEEFISEYFIYQCENCVGQSLWSVISSKDIQAYKDMKSGTPTQTKVIVAEPKTSTQPKVDDSNVLGLLSRQLFNMLGEDFKKDISSKVDEVIGKYVENKVLTKVVEYNGETRKVDGITHEKFNDVLMFVSMNEPVMLVGPAGTGKNVIAKQIADSLGLEFYFSNAVTQEYKITGYGDANGRYVETQFYKAFTQGGLFLLDEIDASSPDALIVLNCAIANGYFDFPVIGRVYAHKDFRVMAAANTFGTGASMEYVGRNQLDAATLDRFSIVEIGYDARIEESVCPDEDILKFTREFRRIADRNGTHIIVSYREEKRLYKMICIAKMNVENAIKYCLTKGVENDTLRMMCNDMNNNIVYKKYLNNIIEN